MNKTQRSRMKTLLGGVLAVAFGWALQAGADLTVTNVAEESSGPYGLGAGLVDHIDIVVTLDEAITVTPSAQPEGTYPRITLKPFPSSGYAYFAGTVSTNGMRFRYSVRPGDFAVDLDSFYGGALELGPAVVTTPSSTNGPLYWDDLPSGVGSLAANADISIKTVDFTTTPSTNIAEYATTTWTVTRDSTGGGTPVSGSLTLNVVSPPTPASGVNVTYTTPVTILATERDVDFDIDGVLAGGPYTFRLRPSGYPTNGVGDLVVSNVTVTAGAKPTFSVSVPPLLYEGPNSDSATYPDQDYCTVTLSTPAPGPITITLTNPSAALIVPGSVSFSAGQSSETFLIEALDGGTTVGTVGITATDLSGTYAPLTFNVTPRNVSPEITNPPEEFEPGPGSEGSAVWFNWGGSDVTADRATLEAYLDFGDGNNTGWIPGATGSTNHIFNLPGTFSVTVQLRDKDGGIAVMNFQQLIEPATEILITEVVRGDPAGIPPGYMGLAGLGQGGIDDSLAETVKLAVPGAETNVFTIKYSPTQPSVVLVGSPTPLSIVADGETNTYDSFFHVWVGEGFLLPGAIEPIANSTARLELDGQDRDIQGVFSREFAPLDNYADIDLDGLPDQWETLWWPEVRPFETPNRMGNDDEDFLPRGANEDMDYPADGGDYTPDGVAFGNIYEVRGFDTDLNAVNSDTNAAGAVLDEPHYDPDTRDFFGTDPTIPDTDGDGMDDGWEYYFWMNAVIRGITGTRYDPTSILSSAIVITSSEIEAAFHPLVPGNPDEDIDGDGLSNIEEFGLGTDPINWDSDGDMIVDGWEVSRNLDPQNKQDSRNNPDGDYMAAWGWTPDMLRTPIPPDAVAPLLGSVHYNVYDSEGYDPRTGWGQSYIERSRASAFLTPNTAEMLNIDEYAIMRFWIDEGRVAAVTPDLWGDYSTDPYSNDTDGDGAPDGWDAYVHFDPSYNEAGVLYDVDFDGLYLTEEFAGVECSPAAGVSLTIGTQTDTVTSSNTVGAVTNTSTSVVITDSTPLANVNEPWWNKFWPSDPNNSDTDGDVVDDRSEMGDYPIGPFLYTVPEGWSSNYIRGAIAGGGLNPTCVDTDMDFLPDAWEVQYRYDLVIFENPDGSTYSVGGMDGSIFDSRSGLTDLTGAEENYDYDGDGLENYQEYYVNAMVHFNYDKWVSGLGYGGYSPADLMSGTPKDWDWALAANYWQEPFLEGSAPPFHVPYIFILPEARPLLPLYASADPSNWDSDGDGMDDYYEMYYALDPLWSETTDLIARGTPATIADIRQQPWTAGASLSDPDQDGIPNWEEAIFPSRPAPANLNSSPSPHWVTDSTYEQSWVNLYYQPTGHAWYWFEGLDGDPVYPYPAVVSLAPYPPSYVYSFANDEGYDTDNDNIPDRMEVTGDNDVGLTDLMDFDSPRLRKALYLDGRSAARTRMGASHELNQLRSWTVEFWVRPEEPVSPTGERQILVERPLQGVSTDPMPAPELVRRTFRVGLEPDGKPFAEYNNMGNELLSKNIQGTGWTLQSNTWYHIAAVLDGDISQFSLYIDGDLVARESSALIPATGIIDGNPPLVISAPIVIGAADRNPNGRVETPVPGSVTPPDLHSNFKGWIDEIRIWHGGRSQAEIVATQMQRFTMDDVIHTMTNYAAAQAEAEDLNPPDLGYQVYSNLPPVVLYHYAFDNLPDPKYDPIVPQGFELLNGRPSDGSYSGIPWWWQAPNRSRVYSDYRFVQWAENTASHVPSVPLVNRFGNVTNYQYGVVQSSPFWTSPPWVTNTTSTNAVFEFPNKTYPSQMAYYTGSSALQEGARGTTGLLPLWYAKADMDVPLWDDGTPGTSSYDSNGDGIPDWWALRYGFDPDGASIADGDDDSDGLSNYMEYLIGADPGDVYSLDPNGLVSDAQMDSDGDGLANIEEAALFGTDPSNPDTDDDGYLDGDEVKGWLPAAVDDYGVGPQVSSPVESISPHVRRSYVAAGRGIEVPHSERFAFLGTEDVIIAGPTVTITAPDDGAQIAVRFTDVSATIDPVGPAVDSVLLYINDRFMAEYGSVESFTDTVILNSGDNIITVYAIDTAGGVGSDSITIEGTFARADIRVTQEWNVSGDLDTWLIDPQGRNMGWAAGSTLVIGPADQPGEAIPGAFLDIDDISGTGPENITLEEPNSMPGEYEVWMNNFSNSGNPMSTVRVLLNEGRPSESYVEFGPEAMPNSGMGSEDAWWHVTTITMPDGTMDPPGAPVLPPDDIEAPDVGLTAENGWTIESWLRPGSTNQSGAIAAYRTTAGNDAFVVGLDDNRPFVQVRSVGGTTYEVMGGAIDADVWTHVAFVYSATDHTLRLHINGLLAAARTMLEGRDDMLGTLYVDTTILKNTVPVSFSDIHIDEFRVWKVARNGGMIAAAMHDVQRPTDTVVAMYRFDDGGVDIEDSRYPLDSAYALGLGVIPDTDLNAKPGPDGNRYTGDDIAFMAAGGADGENDYVTSMEYAPVMGIIDTDDDGIADWYEDMFGIAATSNTVGGLVATEDLDGDGLLNLFEYHARTNPDDEDSDADGTIDPEEDNDGDDVANLDEQLNGTDPWLIDTDDDGIEDNVEMMYGSNPTNSLSPSYSRGLQLLGSSTSLVEIPPVLRLALSDWTLSASVFLENPVAAGTVLAREVQSGQFNYRLAIGADRIPYVTYTDGSGSEVMLSAPDLRALPVDKWVDLSASYSTVSGDLRLSINGFEVAHMNTEGRPKTSGLGPVRSTIGSGIRGYIDNVKILDGAGGTQLSYTFDDATHMSGVSGEVDFRRGQVQDFAPLSALSKGWAREWRDAGTLVNATVSLSPTVFDDGDTDGDGLPDVWEIANGLNPFAEDSDGDGVLDGDEDVDLDGLVNRTEYRAGTDPRNPDTDDDSTLDKDEDADADGLTNMEEQSHGSRADLPDTDDDGLSDFAEVTGDSYTLPTASLSPAVARALVLSDGSQSVSLPDETRFHLTDAWTIEAWVNLDNLTTAGNVISRSIGSSVNYQLGIEVDGTPYARCVGSYGSVDYAYKASDSVPMARSNDWYHLAAVWSKTSGNLELYVNGELRTTELTPDVPGIFSATGAVQNVIGGSGYIGMIDDVRIWNMARSAAVISGTAYDVLDTGAAGLVGYYRFDDGTHAGGTSGTNIWSYGQVEDFAVASENWNVSWTNAATLVAGATVAAVSTPVPASAFADRDADELPDFWELALFGALDAGVASSDGDGDGLTSLFEYRAKLNPLSLSTFEDGIEDGERDPDGDGLVNSEEQFKGTLPCEADTDDDGLTDWEEVSALDDPSTVLQPDRQSNPQRSMDPPRPRSLTFDGSSRALVAAEDTHSLAAWTVEAWVRPTAGADGVVLRRATSDFTGNVRGINYELGIENRGGILYAYAQYVADLAVGATRFRLDGSQSTEILPENPLTGPVVSAGDWTHLAATYEPTNMLMRLYVDGNLVSYRIDAEDPCALGAGESVAVGSEFTIGGGSLMGGTIQNGFEGNIDEVRVISGALLPSDIEDHAAGIGEFYGLVHTVDSSGAPELHVLPSAAAVMQPHISGEILLRFKTGVSSVTQSNVLQTLGTEVIKKHTIVPVTRLKVIDGTDLKLKLNELKANSNVLYAEPNYVRSVSAVPNDPLFSQLWGMHNEGQNGGTADADIDAPEAWDRSTGSDGIVVAVIDTGVNYNHSDLAANMWMNPNETPGNGVDDDGNGFVDDVYGYDFVNNDGDPLDDHDHGSHCSGTIGGVGDNGDGVVGVNWKVRIMAVKAFDASGSGSAGAIVNAIEYAVLMGAQLSNNSYGGTSFSQAEYDAIEMARNAGHLFIAAAGNDGTDNDSIPHYPSSFDLDNIIAVAATDRNDGLASFSCYGLLSVDMGAPGVDINSTLSGGGYGTMSGTSMATPHVTGAAALVLSVNPNLTYDQVRMLLLNGADPISSLDGRVATGARLNVFNALPAGGGGGGGAASGSIVAYFTFDDAGECAEDFTVANDHLRGWRRAAKLQGNAAFDSTEAFGNRIDSDDDGMPDWWEIAMGMDPYSAANDVDPESDVDGDGLTALYEYWSGTDPRRVDTDLDGLNDGLEDADQDTLSNIVEQNLYDTNPANKDTDDDGVEDPDELDAGKDPTDSLSAYVPRAIDFSGVVVDGGNVVTVSDKIDGKYTARMSFPVWTVECLVNPDVLGGGTQPLVSRRTAVSHLRNYEIGLKDGYPYVAFDSAEYGGTNVIVGTSLAPVDSWTHICGRFTEDGVLTLFVNGEEVSELRVTSESAQGAGDVVLGSSGFDGQVMMVRIWRVAQDQSVLKELRNHNLFFGNVSALSGLLRTSGAGFIKENATTETADGLIDQLREDWTLEAWIKTTAGGTVIGKRNGSAPVVDDWNYYLGVEDDGTLLGRFALWYDVYIMDSNNVPEYVRTEFNFVVNNIEGEMSVNDGEWHHVAYVRGDVSCQLYVDGILDAVQNRTLVPILDGGEFIDGAGVRSLQGPVVIGEHLAGDLDETRIWNVGHDTQAEIRDIGWRNLEGDEEGLISYLNYDYQLTDFADERSALRDPLSEYGIYIGDAVRVTAITDPAPIIYDPILALKRVALMAYFSGHDGGDTVEDFTYRMGEFPFDSEKYAGVKGSGVTNATLSGVSWPEAPDSDNDGLVDKWEVQYGLHPGTSEGDDGPYGDPDRDGLRNLAEFMASTDPFAMDTMGSGFGDYDSRPSAFEPTFGQRFDDGDRIADWWEALYMHKTPLTLNRSLDPVYYDAHLDPDEDRWSNYAEFMANTDPTDVLVNPAPLVRVTARYSGRYGDDLTDVIAAGSASTNAVVTNTVTTDVQLHLHFYDTPTRDGFTTATVMTGTAVTELRTFDSGHLSEGMNYIFAFLDMNGDDEWDPVEEPAGIASFNMGWGDWNEVEIPLTDDRQMRGFPRLSWDSVPVEEQAVTLGYTIVAKQSRNTLITRYIENPLRTYLHEGDYLEAGLDGVGGDGSTNAITYTVYKNNTVYGYDFETPTAILIAIVTNTVTETPGIVTGHDITFAYARNELVWTMDANASWYQMTFRANGANGLVDLADSGLLQTNRMTSPFRDVNDQYRADLPFYAGDVRADGGSWTNGRYWVRITSGMEEGASVESEWRAFNLDLKEPLQNGGMSMIEGKLYYFSAHDFFSSMARADGAVSNDMPVIVQSFTNPGFSGVPDAQVTIAPAAWTNTQYRYEAAFELKGLHSSLHYIRTFVDANRNGILDTWETWGYGRDPQTYYEPQRLDLAGAGASRVSDQVVIMRDRDTDTDGLPDIWEYHNYGSATDDSFLNLYGSQDAGANDLLLASRCQYGLDAFTAVTIVDQNANAIPDEWELYYFGRLLSLVETSDDSDGDSMSAYAEYLAGTDPLNAGESLAINRLSMVSPTPTLTWSGPGTVNYRVQYTDALSQAWQQDNTLGNYTRVDLGGGIVYEWTYVDPLPLAGGSRFYRVVVVPITDPLP